MQRSSLQDTQKCNNKSDPWLCAVHQQVRFKPFFHWSTLLFMSALAPKCTKIIPLPATDTWAGVQVRNFFKLPPSTSQVKFLHPENSCLLTTVVSPTSLLIVERTPAQNPKRPPRSYHIISLPYDAPLLVQMSSIVAPSTST